MSAVAEAVMEKVEKPVNPKQGKGGKTVVKGLKMVPTNGHKQVHIKQDIEKAGVRKALRWALDNNASLTADERQGALRVLDRLDARS